MAKKAMSEMSDCK